MTKTLLPLLIAFALAACSAKSRPRSEPLTPSTTVKMVDPPCDEPVLWLGMYSREALSERYCSGECSARCVGEAMPWGFLGADPTRYACDELEYAATAVRAYHGQPVPPRWQELVAQRAWYPRAASRTINAAGQKNVAWLDAAADICRRRYDYKLATAYRERALEFLSNKAEPPGLPAKLFVDGAPATRAAFLEFLRHGDDGQHYFTAGLTTPIRGEIVDAFWREQLGGRTLVKVSVATSSPSLSCIDTSGIDCEGYEGIVFFFDPQTDELVAVAVSAAG